MFAIPGLAGLLLFVYLRPQEIFEPLAGVTFAMATSLVVLGIILDWRLSITRPRWSRVTGLSAAFFSWSMLTAVILAPSHLTFIVAISSVAVVMYVVIAEGVQSFRALEVMLGLVLGIILVLALVGIHQGFSPTMCILRSGAGDVGSGEVITDGRSCATAEDCDRDRPDPEAEYWCDHVGLFGTSAVGGRVRYRGILQDPNEMAWVLSLGVPMAFTFFERKRSLTRFLLALGTTVAVMICVVMTRSRSGQMSLLVVLGAYFIRRFRWKGALVGAVLALPLLAYGGRSGAEAESSSTERLECWQAGIEMWKEMPFTGVGYGNFGEHHSLTAHNSFILTLAETGPLGLFLFTALLYAAIKMLAQAVRDFSHSPGAEVAGQWAMALLAGMLGTLVSVFFLSIAYNAILWVFLGFVAAFYAAVIRHQPRWKVPFGWKDLTVIGAFDFTLIAAIAVYIRLKGI
ncbi:MAG TPA: O-antigen ligase family protein [Polyangia bacterium]|jgi:hypothetical protein|nr:O-antigen ligase family protein [Polyangia bacterium]